jgi:hypothetical protein
MGPRTGMDDMEKWQFLTLPGLGPRPLDRSARSKLLYRLRNCDSFSNTNTIKRNYETESVSCWCCIVIRGLATDSKLYVIQISG